MKLTKKLEVEVLKMYKAYWEAYLKGDMKTFASMLDDDITVFGTAVSEVFNNKKEALKFYKATASQLAGKAQFRNRQISLQSVDNNVLLNEQCDFYVLIEKKWTYYGHARVSAILKQTKTGWKLIHQHASFPDTRADEGEQLAAEKIKEENLQLRDAVKRRTVELENKNRELEIESSLEKVRAQAMGMHKPDDLLNVCKVLFKELTLLGFSDIRNAIIHTFNDEEKYFIDYDYSDLTGGVITNIPYSDHPVIKRFLKQIRKSDEAFAEIIVKGKELKEWKTFRKRGGQPDDPGLDKTSALYYYFHSVGTGDIGISTFNSINEEKLQLLKRFRNVFDLAYKRYTDIKKAEAQSREAQIQLSLEKIRARAMAMHHSDELSEVLSVLFDQFDILGICPSHATISLIDTEKHSFTFRMTGKAGKRVMAEQVISLDALNMWRDTVDQLRRSDSVHVYCNEYPKEILPKLWELCSEVIAAIPPKARPYPKDFPDGMFEAVGIYRLTGNIAYGTVSFCHYRKATEEEKDIVGRFATEFGRLYQRFLDLQKAEAQGRESDIELSLERVRAKTMAMQKPSEFVDVVNVIGEQFVHLGFDIEWANFGANGLDVFNGIDVWNFAVIPGLYQAAERLYIPYIDHPVFAIAAAGLAKYQSTGEDFFVIDLDKKDKDRWMEHMYTRSVFKEMPEEFKTIQYNKPGYTSSVIVLKDSWLSIGKFDPKPFTEEQNGILRRFANAFGQAYTRFLDLQKAEAQARESDIELSLERVRAKTMAMQKPSEFVDVINIIGEQFIHLGFDIDWANFGANGFDISEGIDIWNFAVIPGASPISARVFIPYFDHPVFTTSVANINEFLNGGRDLITVTLDKQTKDTWLDQLFTKTIFKDVPEEYRVIQYAKPGYTTSNISLKDTWLSIGKFDIKNFTDEQHAILRKFANAFGQAYTRFLDLQKAEAQAREAQIEAGLERVRSRAMAMQSSEQLRELIGTVFTELTKLDIVLTRCLIMIYDPKSNDSVWWMANSEAPTQPIGLKVQYHEHPSYLAYVNAWKQKELKWTYTLEGNTKKEWDDFLFVETELSHLPDFVIAGMKAPDRVYLNASFNSFGNLTLATLEPLSDEHFDIMLRFAKVFDLTYTRFNDLKQAEAQAREARIETALERVRSRTMAMHRSEELAETAEVLFKQLSELGNEPARISIGLPDEKAGTVNFWITDQSGHQIKTNYKGELTEPTSISKIFKGWKARQKSIMVDLQGKEFENWVRYSRKEIGAIVKSELLKKRRVHNVAYFSHGWLNMSTNEPTSTETINLLERFASVFNLTYRRFLDLQQAEAQAREARIETALERVRARTMAMQKSDELPATAFLLFQQLKALGETAAQLSIGIIKEEEGYVELSATVHGNQLLQTYQVPVDEPYIMGKVVKAWKEKQRSLTLEIKGKELKEYNSWRNSVLEKKIDFPEDQWIINIVFFSKGMLSFSSDRQIPKETLQLLERFASVFDHTYTRFLDLKQAEAQARESQIEASLERVRSRSLAMHNTSELQEVIHTVHKELLKLNIAIHGGSFIAINQEIGTTLRCWGSGGTADTSEEVHLPLYEKPFCTNLINRIKNGPGFFTEEYTQKEKKDFFTFLFQYEPWSKLDSKQKEETLSSPGGYTRSCCVSTHTSIFIINHFGEKFSNTDNDILKRFGKVFDQTYTRFLDLQKAETQTRETQIELALERVRARTMAMHKSEELAETAEVLYHQLKELGDDPERITIGLLNEDTGVITWWATDQGGSQLNIKFQATVDEPTVMLKLYNGWKAKNESLVIDLTGKELADWVKYCREVIGVPIKEELLKNRRVQTAGFFSHGWVMITSPEPTAAKTINILERFASVFNLTYRRFLDLQKAEAQAKEAQIESALEKVRSRSLAMHKSDELQEVVNTVFERLKDLDIEVDSSNIAIFKEGTRDFDYWIASNTQKRSASFHMPYIDLSLTKDIVAARESGADFSATSYPFDVKNEWFDFAFKETDFKFLSKERKQFIFNAPAISVAIAFSKHTGVQVNRYSDKLLSEGEAEILKRFSKVFEQAYIRFRDLEKAESQARESQIEASLERVRSKTMAMHNSHDVGNTVASMFDQLVQLGVTTNRCGILIFSNTNNTEVWTAKSNQAGEAVLIIGHLDVMIHPMLQEVRHAWKNKETFYSYELAGGDIKNYYSAINNYPDYPTRFNLDNLPSKEIHSDFFFSEGAVFAFTSEQIAEEAALIFKRFAGVFGQTYRRYLDLLKAEANAREAQIEAGLERVRAKAMAMHSSKDLAETLSVFYRELKSLSVVPIRCGVALMDKETRMAELTTMNTTGEGDSIEIIGKIKMAGHPVLDGVFESWLVQKEYHAVLRGNQIKEYYQVLKPQIDYLDYSQDEAQFGYYFMFNEGDVYAWTEKELTEDELTIYRRFTTVISLTYKRYKDLQQAEAQAREAKIEAGLERVRARTMAMHSSEDVSIATATMFTELEKLGIQNLRGGITIIKTGDKQEVWGVTNLPDGKTIRSIGEFDMHLHPLWRELLKAKLNNGDYNYYRLTGKDKEDYINILNATPNYLSQPIKDFPDVHVQSYFFGEGAIWTNSLEPHSEEQKQTMKRFASVFSLTFRRYQDLKKAEAQAREATIESALEKVRGKAMAMHNSNDLTATASLVFTELRKLGISPMRCGVGMLNKENRKALLYTAIASEEGDSLSQIGWVLLDVNPVLKSIYDHWVRGEDYFPVLKKEMLKAYYEHLKSGFVVPEEQTEYEHHGYFLPFSEGVFYGWSERPFTETEIKILKRFASVIDLTFRRYIELQKSETNAREAVKQAALDRVRAEIASMRTVNDLDRITPLIWNELTILGIPFIRCGVFIMDDEQQLIHTFLSTPDGKAIAAFHLPYDTPGNLAHVVANWKKNKKYIDHWDEAEFIQFANILVKEGALVSSEQYLKTIPKGGFYLHFLPFLQGMLYVGNTDQLKEEEIELIQHVADAFSTAYARYEDFNKLESAKQQVEKTLTDLKQTQQQLVQSEKMASLGEMTAGIAHEIQNPLNFVNNFSEVSKELLDEMKTELETGNTQDAKDIADDVIQNLEKINHHGKRADAIVKSMLQHSRSSSGKKEPTDINALADEYLRLAYHGLRAKDKSFNAKFETEFDNSIGKINIISQDIGRVLVNLINNAFYAVSERKKQESNGYEPTVEVFTKKMNDRIEIKVRDNGNGIPKKVLDKIFQPFFTTKPTGQGTGLGLSLSYDIITKGHNGELKVETKEGEGSEFIIQLPNQSS